MTGSFRGFTVTHWVCWLSLVCLFGCQQDPGAGWQGYVEGDYLYVAAQRGGRLLQLTVRKGETVTAGTLLFTLDPEPEQTVVKEAASRLQQAQSRRDDLLHGERPSEIEALQARREQVKIARGLAANQLQRAETLLPINAVSQEDYDRARAELERSEAALAELDAQLVTAELGGRIDQLKAQEADVEAAAAAMRQAEWALAEKRQVATTDALVFDTIFEPGEMVPASAPVVVLLPPAGRKARFYVPEEQLATVKVGDKVRLHYDGGDVSAVISYISPQAEYTPPVIYSRETRSKLVYLLEARPAEADDALRLTPGQPLEVMPE